MAKIGKFLESLGHGASFFELPIRKFGNKLKKYYLRNK